MLATSGRPHSRRRWSLVITSRPPARVPAVANPSSPDGVTQACRARLRGHRRAAVVRPRAWHARRALQPALRQVRPPS